MSKLVVCTNLTLDGVMQAPGQPDEDQRGGFEYGGWAAPYAAMMEADSLANMGALLFGRRTYENFAAVWPSRVGNPFTEILNNIQKYVASTTMAEPLPWMNSTLLKGDVAEALNRLKAEAEKDIVIFGSGELIQSLMRRNVIDEYVLLFHPLVLGTGRRLFPDNGVFAALRLVKSKTTASGVVIANYVPLEIRREQAT